MKKEKINLFKQLIFLMVSFIPSIIIYYIGNYVTAAPVAVWQCFLISLAIIIIFNIIDKLF